MAEQTNPSSTSVSSAAGVTGGPRPGSGPTAVASATGRTAVTTSTAGAGVGGGPGEASGGPGGAVMPPAPLVGAPGVLYFDPNPTTAKLATAGLRLAGYQVMHASTQTQAVELCRVHGPGGDKTIVALLLDTATAPAVSASVLRALIEVPGAAELPGVLLVSRANPNPFPGAENLPSLKRPFATPALLKVLRDTIDVAPRAKPAPSRQTVDEAVLRLELALQQHFPDLDADAEALRSFAATLTNLAELPTLASGVALQAELGVTRLESVLELLAADGARGVVTVEHAGVRARLHVDRGRIRMAEIHPKDDELELVRFAAEQIGVDVEAVARVAASADPSLRPLGLRLVAEGVIKPDDLSAMLVAQAREITCHVLPWNHGRISFAPADELHPLVAELTRGKGELRIAEALLVGLRRADERAEMGPQMPGVDDVFVRVDEEVARLGRHAFSREELGVLELLSGRSSIKEIARKTRAGTFAVAKIVYRLARGGLCKRRTPPVHA